MATMKELSEIGQSIWLDYILRSFMASGGLKALVEKGLGGVTSNPSIFENAIAGSDDYDSQIKELSKVGLSTEEIYEALALKDIAQAADELLPVFERTNGQDGYVSFEVNPTLADMTQETISEAKRIFSTLGKPNVMIKVPATKAGIPAIKELTSAGVNVNVTLIINMDHYQAAAEAFQSGMEELAANGPTVQGGRKADELASVASFFVSRTDSAMEKKLADAGRADLDGHIAVDYSKVVAREFYKVFSTPSWEKLAAQGARPQRLLWGSTATKNPAFSDTLYVDELIGPDTVNTIPPATLDKFLDHGTASETLTKGLDDADMRLKELAGLGIDIVAITQEIQDNGVASFTDAYNALLASIEEKLKNYK